MKKQKKYTNSICVGEIRVVFLFFYQTGATKMRKQRFFCLILKLTQIFVHHIFSILPVLLVVISKK